MSDVNAKLLEQALKLPPDQRVELAEKLIESLDTVPLPSPQLSAAWEAEIQRRIEEIDSGDVELIPADEVFRKLDERRRDKAPR